MITVVCKNKKDESIKSNFEQSKTAAIPKNRCITGGKMKIDIIQQGICSYSPRIKDYFYRLLCNHNRQLVYRFVRQWFWHLFPAELQI
jgi:hypothetical protein